MRYRQTGTRTYRFSHREVRQCEHTGKAITYRVFKVYDGGNYTGTHTMPEPRANTRVVAAD